MIQINKTIVSESIISEDFVCNLSSCKGQCCVAGSAGAPLENNERQILDKLNKKISPFLSDKGRKSINEQGNYVSIHSEKFNSKDKKHQYYGWIDGWDNDNN